MLPLWVGGCKYRAVLEFFAGKGCNLLANG